jgi:hypothetical protein
VRPVVRVVERLVGTRRTCLRFGVADTPTAGSELIDSSSRRASGVGRIAVTPHSALTRRTIRRAFGRVLRDDACGARRGSAPFVIKSSSSSDDPTRFIRQRQTVVAEQIAQKRHGALAAIAR